MAVGEVMMVKKLAEVSGSDASTPPPELHVLAVDDSFVDRKVIEKLLQISACKVTVVESGTRALQYLGLDGENNADNLKDLKVNLIMTDYSMPGITGYELLKKIKESSAFKEIPVVIMSSENILPRIERCLEEGAEDFLLKPVKLSDVKRLTETIMRGDPEECETEGPERNIEHEIVPSSPPLQSHEILPLNESAPNSRIKAEPVALS